MNPDEEDGAALLLLGAAVARRAQQILGYQDEAMALAVTVAVRQVVEVVEGSENCLAALDEFESLEQAIAE